MESYISRTSGIKARDKIGYAFGDLASCLVFGLTQSVLNKYYTDVLEISVLNVMIMTIIARIWDAVNDPIWGRLIDGAKLHGDGRYRHWIRIFALPAVLRARHRNCRNVSHLLLPFQVSRYQRRPGKDRVIFGKLQKVIHRFAIFSFFFAKRRYDPLFWPYLSTTMWINRTTPSVLPARLHGALSIGSGFVGSG